MKRAKGAALVLAAVLVLATSLSACGDASTNVAEPAPADSVKPDTEIINFAGTHGVHFGDTRTTLASLGKLGTTEAGCAEQLAEVTAAHPVFDRDKLVLMWAYPPLHTPEGVMVGTPMGTVKTAYPDAVALTPPPGTTTFPAILVRDNQGDAYLILHNKDEVQKLIVGYEDSARLLYTTGFGAC